MESTDVEPMLTVDLDRWPIVVLTYQGNPSAEMLIEHLDEIEERVLSREEPFVQIIDSTHGIRPAPIQRAVIAQHQGKCAALYERYCQGEAYVVNPEFRGAMVAIFWMEPPPYSYTFVDTLDEALAWAERISSR